MWSTFDTKQELEELLESIKPDTMVVGSDWKGKEVVGSRYAKSVRFFDRQGDYSTTQTIQGTLSVTPALTDMSMAE